MCKKIGPKKALQAAEYHETFRKGVLKRRGEWSAREERESEIDRQNNLQGLVCCKANCWVCCHRGFWYGYERPNGGGEIIRRRGPGVPEIPNPITPGQKEQPTGPITPGQGKNGGKGAGGGKRGPGKKPKPDGPSPVPPHAPDDEDARDHEDNVDVATTTTGSGRGSRGRQGSVRDLIANIFSDLVGVTRMDTEMNDNRRRPRPWSIPTGDDIGSFPDFPGYDDPCASPSNWCPKPGGGGGGGGLCVDPLEQNWECLMPEFSDA